MAELTEEQRHKMQETVRLMLTTDLKNGEIAEIVGVSNQTISNWNGRGDFKELRREITRDAFEEFAPRAVKTLVDLLDARSEKVRLDAATQILDRAGFVIPEKVEFSGAVNFVEDVPVTDD